MTSKSMLPKNNPDRFHIEIHCTDKFLSETKDRNAASILASKSQLSKQKIKNLMQEGAVWLHRGKEHKRIRKGNTAIHKGDRLALFYDDFLLNLELEKPVLLEDLKDYSIWFKPYGILSQGTQWGDKHSLLRFAELNLQPQRPAFLIHRLDREACGLMIIAHSKKASAQLSNIFSERKVEKHYLAIVKGKPAENKFTIKNNIEGKEAISHFNLLKYDESTKTSLLDANIETGRKHQIRIHLSQMNSPIIGDSLYGNKKYDDKKVAKKNMKLCALSLSFDCPVTEKKQLFKLPEKFLIDFQ